METPNLEGEEVTCVQEKVSYTLEMDMELRFEVEMKKSPVILELETGSAELFGTQLAPKRHYKIMPGTKVAVFTWHGCALNIYGQVDGAYTSENTPMVMYLNLHAGLDQMRTKADSEMGRGPRVLVTGPTGVGRSTLCKVLVNYASRTGWCPMLVDLDVGQNDISLPGTIAALPICQPAEVEEGYMLDAPLIYHFGHMSPENNVEHYNLLVKKLADSINIKCDISNTCNVSGAVINTSGWIQKDGYQCLLNAINAFEAEVVVVLEQELLYKNLSKDVPNYVKVVPLPKPGGVFEMTQKRIEKRNFSIRSYFYGCMNNLFPHVFDVKFSDVQIFKVVAFKFFDTLLPIGMSNQDNSIKLAPVPISGSLQFHVLSTSYASSKDEDVIQTNISGFIIITKVDMEKQQLTLLSPQPRPFPWNILLLIEGLTYHES